MFAGLADGGTWGIPRAGLAFQREGDTFVLIGRMPWERSMGMTEREFFEMQSTELEATREHFAAAGIEVVVREERAPTVFDSDQRGEALG